MMTFRVQFLLLACVVLLTITVVSCFRNTVDKIDPKFLPQLRSLSVSGPNQASLIVEPRDGTNSIGPWPAGEIRLTKDGGQSWSVVPSSDVGALACTTMTENNNVWAINRQGQVFVTGSAGAAWTRIGGTAALPSSGETLGSANRIEFLNETEGWANATLSIWRTRDRGVTWHEVLSTLTPGVHGQPTGISAIDTKTLVASGTAGQVYLTTDGGETWKISSPLPGNFAFYDVWFEQKHGWITGGSAQSYLLETTDGGQSWKEVSINQDIQPSSVCFVGDVGWLAGSRRLLSGDGEKVSLVGILLRSEDGGKNWSPVEFGQEEPFFTEVRFTDKMLGWLVGRDSVLRSVDGGKTWNRVLTLPPPKDRELH